MTPRNGFASHLSLFDLERMIRGRQRQLNQLQKRRAKIQRKLDALDVKIAAITGGGRGAGTGAGSRSRNGANLPDTIAKVLARSRGPMSVGDIAERVVSGGYRTNSGNFRAVVNVALIKDKRFASAGRGVYRLKRSEK